MGVQNCSALWTDSQKDSTGSETSSHVDSIPLSTQGARTECSLKWAVGTEGTEL